jgi:hypothetical protein
MLSAAALFNGFVHWHSAAIALRVYNIRVSQPIRNDMPGCSHSSKSWRAGRCPMWRLTSIQFQA